MRKLLDRLQKQLLSEENKKDAEDCLLIYNYLHESTGHVWESTWKSLVNVKFIGNYPYKRTYKPTSIGYTLIKGICS